MQRPSVLLRPARSFTENVGLPAGGRGRAGIFNMPSAHYQEPPPAARNAIPPVAPPASEPVGSSRLGGQSQRNRDAYLRMLPPLDIVAIDYDLIGPKEDPRSVAPVVITSAESVGPNSLGDSRMGAVGAALCGLCLLTASSCPQHLGRIELASPVVHPYEISRLIQVLNCVCPKCGSLLADRADVTSRGIDQLAGLPRLTAMSELCKSVSVCPNPECNEPITMAYDSKASAEKRRVLRVPRDKKAKLALRPAPMEETEIAQLLGKRVSDATKRALGFGASDPRSFVLNYIIVLPPAVRPPAVLQDGTLKNHDLTEAYKKIVAANDAVRGNPGKKDTLVDAIYQLFVKAGKSSAVTKKTFTLTSMMNSKQGIPRKHTQSGRAAFNARNVIGPEPNIPFGTERVPRVLAKVLTVPQVVAEFNIGEIRALHAFGTIKTLTYGPNRPPELRGNTFKISSANFDRVDFVVGDTVGRELQNGDLVLFTRQPVIHKQGIMGHRVVLGDGLTVGVNLADTTPYNADFDGDEATTHVPQSQSGIEADVVMGVQQCVIDEQTNKNMIGIVYDALTGAYLLTGNDVDVAAPLFHDCLSLIAEDFDRTEFLARGAAGGLIRSEFDRARVLDETVSAFTPRLVAALPLVSRSALRLRLAPGEPGQEDLDLNPPSKDLLAEYAELFKAAGNGEPLAMPLGEPLPPAFRGRLQVMGREAAERRVRAMMTRCARLRYETTGADGFAQREAAALQTAGGPRPALELDGELRAVLSQRYENLGEDEIAALAAAALAGAARKEFRGVLDALQARLRERLALPQAEEEALWDVFWGVADEAEARARAGGGAEWAEALAALSVPMGLVVALNDVPSGARTFASVEKEVMASLPPDLRAEWADPLGHLKGLAELLRRAAAAAAALFSPSAAAALERENGRLLAQTFLAVLERHIGEGRFYFPGRLLASAVFPPGFQYPSVNQDTYGQTEIEIVDGILRRGQLDKRAIGQSPNSIIQRLRVAFGEAATSRVLTFLPIIVNKWLETWGFTIGVADCFLSPEVAAEVKRAIEAELILADAKVKELRRYSGTPEGRRKIEELISTLTSNIKTVGSRVAGKLPPSHPLKVMLGAGSKATPEALVKMITGGALGQIFVHGRRPTEKMATQRHTPWSAPATQRLQDYGFVARNYATGLDPVSIFPEQEAGRASNVTIATEASKVGSIDRQLAVNLQGLIISADGSVRTERGRAVQPLYAEDGFARAMIQQVKTPTAVDRRTTIPSFVDVDELAQQINAASRREAEQPGAGAAQVLPALFFEEALVNPVSAADLAAVTGRRDPLRRAVAAPAAPAAPRAERGVLPRALPSFKSPPAAEGTTKRDILYRDFAISQALSASVARYVEAEVRGESQQAWVAKEIHDALEHALINAMNHPAMTRVRTDESAWTRREDRPLEETTLVWQVLHNGAWLDEGPKASQMLFLKHFPFAPFNVNYAVLRVEQTVQRLLREQAIEPSRASEIQIEDRGGRRFIVFRRFRRELTGRLDTLLRLSGEDKDALLCMLLAYATLFPGGQQWTYLAFDRYRSLKAEITEGFASPLNSLALMREEPWRPEAARDLPFDGFCSLFPTLDAPFGSIGDFFSTPIATPAVAVNPPYTEKVLAAAARRTVELLTDPRSPVRIATFIGPADWKDAEFEAILRAAASPQLSVGAEKLTWAQANAYDLGRERPLANDVKTIYFFTLARRNTPE
jgi:DNA-directed RNA polymerase beta' subunit